MSLIYKGQTIAGVGGTGGGSSEEIYSTEETRIGTWIDGRPIYKKTVSLDSFSVPPINSPAAFPYFENVNTIVFDSVIIEYTVSEKHSMDTFDAHIKLLNNSIVIHRTAGSVPVQAKVIATLEYTKTTDEATS